MSRPPATCWHSGKLPLGKPAAAHVVGTTETMRGATPGAPSMRAAMELGRCEMTSERNSGVSTNELTVSELLLLRPSYEKKKKALFLRSEERRVGKECR